MKYKSNKKYSFYYHYMHDNPSCIVKVECYGCILERTIDLIKQDPMVIISDVKEIEE